MLKKSYTNVEFECPTGLYTLDMVFTEYGLAVEIDGSSHFYDLSKHELAKSKFKYRLLEKAGIDVFRIKFHDYIEKTQVPEHHGGYAINEKKLLYDI